MSKTTFALRNFSGQPVQHIAVTTESVPTPTAVKQPTHHVIIIDRSGSMYCDLPDTKAMVEKLLTLGEFNDPLQKISLISYSSQGDVKLHFAKVTVEDVLRADSPYLKEIRSIQVTGLTCISQSLTLAQSLVDDADTTCITLHSDGYANDRSPAAERTAIIAAVEVLAKRPNVFVNTIAYRESSDFTLLSCVANMASGVCVQAKSIKQVYEALHTAQATLAGNMAPALVMAKAGDYTVFCSSSAGKVLGSNADMIVRGLKDTDDKAIYRFEFVDEVTAGSLSDADPKAVLAYARAQVSEGNINNAKYALCGIKSDLLPKHYRALVAGEVAAMASDIEQALFTGTVGQTASYGLASNGPSVLDVLDVLSKFAKSLRVNTKVLGANYKRQGVKRIAGTREADGSVTAPLFDLKTGGDYAEVLSFDFNRNTATVNLLTAKKAELVQTSNGAVISEVAGIDVTGLKDYRNFTVVGDGNICTPVLPLKISDKRCHKALVDMGVVSGDFDPNADVEVNLGSLALIDFDKKFALADNVFARLANLTAAQKVLTACVKEASDAFTAEQIADLKAHYLSSSLYFSGPTTTHYADLQAALAKGEVDTRLSYKIEVGALASLTALGKLPSANAFLDRRFTLTLAGVQTDKPKMTSVLDTDAVWAEKVLGPRIKLTKVDDFLFPIFKSFLLDGGKGAFADILINEGIDPTELLAALSGTSGEAKVEAILNASRAVSEKLEGVYHGEVSPLVFYIGATGLVPDDLGAKAHTAEQVETQWPELALSKDEKEGLFYVLPNGLILTVFIKGEYYTTAAGLAA